MTAVFLLGVAVGLGFAITYYIWHIPPTRED